MAAQLFSAPPHTGERHSASVIYIDPPMARRVLERNTRNRPISELHVSRLLADIAAARHPLSVRTK